MRIAQLAPAWIPIPPVSHGGTEYVISYLVEEQIAQGHEVTLFAPGDAKTSAKHISFFPQSLSTCDISWKLPFKAIEHLNNSVQYIKEHNLFDIVHAHISSPSDLFLFSLLGPLSVPAIATLHSPYNVLAQYWNCTTLHTHMKWMSQLPLVAVSGSARLQAPSFLHFIHTVYHGLPKDSFPPMISERDGFFFWLGRILPEKGTHLAIHAAKKAQVPIILAGTVDQHMDASRDYFQHVVEPLIDHQQVTYIGPVTTDQKRYLFSHASGFLNPIEWEEPFGMVMIEALALGCPIISFARGAAKEIIEHERTGFLVHNVDEMAQCIPKITEIDLNQVRFYAEDHFSVDTMASKYIDAYQKVINSKE